MHFSLFRGMVLTQITVHFDDFLEGGQPTHSQEIPIKLPLPLPSPAAIFLPHVSCGHVSIKSDLSIHNHIIDPLPVYPANTEKDGCTKLHVATNIFQMATCNQHKFDTTIFSGIAGMIW